MGASYDLVIEHGGEKYVAVNGLLAATYMPNVIMDASALMKVGFEKGEGLASILRHVLAGFALQVAGIEPGSNWSAEEIDCLMTQLKKPASGVGPLSPSLTFAQLHEASTLRSVEWMGKASTIDDLLFTGVELGGESGEVLNAIKKLWRFQNQKAGGVPLEESKRAIGEEIADVVICAERIAEALGIDLGEAVRAKFNKTSEKYGLVVRMPAPIPRGKESV